MERVKKKKKRQKLFSLPHQQPQPTLLSRNSVILEMAESFSDLEGWESNPVC